MEIIQNIIEYYDELYPVTEAQKKFYREQLRNYPDPAKLLRVGCGTGLFEHLLAREGKDVTGIESFQEMLRSANLRRRNQLMSIRFFQMSYLDMARFLGKGFYNLISILDDRIIFIHDKTLLRKFFFDCKQLLAQDGCLIISLYNYRKFNRVPLVHLPQRKSLRVTLSTEIASGDNGGFLLSQNIETGSGKILPVVSKDRVCPVTDAEIRDFAGEAGFAECEFYSSWEKEPFTGSEDTLVALLR
ncbi:MAG: class I SAM-dependent methyltransferase [Treponema sp.]|nr:class I SAM-dependent methyltransferase [Treponema sp.]MBR0476689.1 class I SAM-dependent methyltransferase [Treponema sp.]